MNSRNLSTVDLGNSLFIDLINCHAMSLIKPGLFFSLCGEEKQLEAIQMESWGEVGCLETAERAMIWDFWFMCQL